MTGAEKGFLLLTSHLGNPERRVLPTAQLRLLANRIRRREQPTEDRELEEGDIVALGFGREMAKRMVELLSEEELLQLYCQKGKKAQCLPLTWATAGYPEVLRTRLADESPGCLWCKGDVSLLERPKVSLVGSRDLLKRNRVFAAEVGLQAAKQGYVLVSGNARGADRTAQQACLDAGGCVISVVADKLTDKPLQERILYLSEDEYDADFSPQRAISRNRVIHALGQCVFVAQCNLESGGTWDGTVKNLRGMWSPVYCFQDSGPALSALQQMGAEAIEMETLSDIAQFTRRNTGFFEE